MKKRAVCVLMTLLLCISAAACSGNESSESSINKSEPSVTSARVTSAESSDNSENSNNSDNSDISVFSEISEEKSEESSASLPEGITRNTNGSLKYKNDFLSMSVSFPADFCILDKDYTPVNGIYLRNVEGNATLQLESVEDNDINAADLAEFLKSKYDDAIVYVTDTKDVVCKTSVKDRSGNRVMSYLKIRTKRGGYNEAILYFHESDKDIFDNIFNQIVFG